ncbi:DUF402 domain-containing protein [Actinoplanes sp. NPDC020271]|uniref:DUF402 domain-containing protein n=1 Tax=Actinoplanes sp. NPDC020271 TaxID=3363896 RepID=UPI00379DB3CB
MDVVDLVLLKYDGRPHRRVTGQLLGEDEFGTWIGTPRGTMVRYSYGLRRVSWTKSDSVRLVPRDAWWMAMFSAAPSRSEIYCDVITPVRRTGETELTVVDLDIDVIRMRAGGGVVIDDEDEFAEHRILFGYPDDVVAAATGAAAELHAALTGDTEPFAGKYREWLGRVTGPGRREPRHR